MTAGSDARQDRANDGQLADLIGEDDAGDENESQLDGGIHGMSFGCTSTRALGSSRPRFRRCGQIRENRYLPRSGHKKGPKVRAVSESWRKSFPRCSGFADSFGQAQHLATAKSRHASKTTFNNSRAILTVSFRAISRHETRHTQRPALPTPRLRRYIELLLFRENYTNTRTDQTSLFASSAIRHQDSCSAPYLHREHKPPHRKKYHSPDFRSAI